MDPFEDSKLRVNEATDLVALIESYMPLKPRGRLLVALCPFHAESSPSFISPMFALGPTSNTPPGSGS